MKSIRAHPRLRMGETYCTTLGMTVMLWEGVIDDNGLRDIVSAQGKVLSHPQGPLPCLVFTSN